MSESEKSQLVNETHWQYYGTAADTGGNLSLTWNTSLLPMLAVTIELWGYEETGGTCRGLVEVPGTSDTPIGENGDGGRGMGSSLQVERKKGFEASIAGEEGFAAG